MKLKPNTREKTIQWKIAKRKKKVIQKTKTTEKQRVDKIIRRKLKIMQNTQSVL